MEYSCTQLIDLPDEILLIIFKKLNNVTLLYSLFGINERLDQILYDSIFTSHLNLLNRTSNDYIYKLYDSILNRFCFQILPKIHDKIQCLNLESLTMERILSINFPNLHKIGLYNLGKEKAKFLFSDETILFHRFKSKILSLTIHINPNDKQIITKDINIFTMFTNLEYFNFSPCSIRYQQLSFRTSPPPIFSSNLLELHVNLSQFTGCLYILDGCFNQLRKLYVNISSIISSSIVIDNKKKLSNLRCFILYCDLVGNSYDELIVPCLLRMSNLEELSLNIVIFDRETFVDGDDLKNIINHMTHLKTFTFNIYSTIRLDNQINLPSNENIRNTFENFQDNQIISCVDYFLESRKGQCHIHSYPYTLKEYNNITNNFPSGLFECVHTISLFDEQPFP